MSVALVTGLYATHTLVPPTPGPIAAAGNIGASDYLGTIILVGFIVAIPTILVGYYWAMKVGTKIEVKGEGELQFDYDDIVKSFERFHLQPYRFTYSFNCNGFGREVFTMMPIRHKRWPLFYKA